MPSVHRIETVISEDGKLLLDQLPFRAGQTVEVIVLPLDKVTTPCHELQGKVLRYFQPTAPISEKDWDALP
jgi:hypothetical protein